jgi:hypothetical protein
VTKTRNATPGMAQTRHPLSPLNTQAPIMDVMSSSTKAARSPRHPDTSQRVDMRHGARQTKHRDACGGSRGGLVRMPVGK